MRPRNRWLDPWDEFRFNGPGDEWNADWDRYDDDDDDDYEDYDDYDDESSDRYS